MSMEKMSDVVPFGSFRLACRLEFGATLAYQTCPWINAAVQCRARRGTALPTMQGAVSSEFIPQDFSSCRWWSFSKVDGNFSFNWTFSSKAKRCGFEFPGPPFLSGKCHTQIDQTWLME